MKRPACRPKSLAPAARIASSTSLKRKTLDERREHLLAGDAHVLADVGEHGRLPEPALALAAGEDARALLPRLLHPLLDALGGRVVDQRADVGASSSGSPACSASHALDELVTNSS